MLIFGIDMQDIQTDTFGEGRLIQEPVSLGFFQGLARYRRLKSA